MKLVKLGLVCSALLMAACSGEDGVQGAPGQQGPAGADGNGNGNAGAESINGISPARSFPGRTVRLAISGDNTTWTSIPTVTVDDAAIAATNITVASPTSLVLDLVIGPAATLGEKTITVADKTIKGFRVEPALVSAFAGKAEQGAILLSSFRNRDVENPFNPSTSLFDSGNAGVLIDGGADSSNLAEPAILIDVDATGSANIGITDAYTGIASYAAEPLSISARAPEALASEDVAVAIPAGQLSKLYSFTGSGGENGGFVSFQVDPAEDAPAGISLFAAALGASGKWSDGFTPLGQTRLLTRPGASKSGYLVLADLTGTGGYNLTLSKSVSSFMGKEIEPNESKTAATPFAFSEPWFGDLVSQADQDWYQVTVPANHHLRVMTQAIESTVVDIPGQGETDVVVDARIAIYGTDEEPLAADTDELTTGALGAGTYYIQITTTENTFTAGATAYLVQADVFPADPVEP